MTLFMKIEWIFSDIALATLLYSDCNSNDDLFIIYKYSDSGTMVDVPFETFVFKFEFEKLDM